jgi:hypothetical protein
MPEPVAGNGTGIRRNRISYWQEYAEGIKAPEEAENIMKEKNIYPKGWDQEKVKEIIDHYEGQ